MINEAEKQFIERAGASVKVNLHPDLKKIGVEAPHEQTHTQEVIDQGKDIGAQHAGDNIPPSTHHEGFIDEKQFETARHKPPTDAIRWLAELKKKRLQQKELNHAT